MQTFAHTHTNVCTDMLVYTVACIQVCDWVHNEEMFLIWWESFGEECAFILNVHSSTCTVQKLHLNLNNIDSKWTTSHSWWGRGWGICRCFPDWAEQNQAKLIFKDRLSVARDSFTFTEKRFTQSDLKWSCWESCNMIYLFFKFAKVLNEGWSPIVVVFHLGFQCLHLLSTATKQIVCGYSH